MMKGLGIWQMPCRVFVRATKNGRIEDKQCF